MFQRSSRPEKQAKKAEPTLRLQGTQEKTSICKRTSNEPYQSKKGERTLRGNGTKAAQHKRLSTDPSIGD